MTRWVHVLAFLCLGALFAGCSQDELTQAPSPGPTTSPAAMSTGFFEGEIGPGSYYALSCPEPWNGDLVIVAHGYYSPMELADPPRGEEFFYSTTLLGFLELGYGVAYTSYPANGWAVKEGMIALHQLRGLFASRFGSPDRTFLAGLSMGGLMVVALAEKYPHQYAGVLAESGPLGGAAMIFDQIFGVRAVFDYYYPGVLPGSVLRIPPDTLPTDAFEAAVNAMVANPGPVAEIASVEQFDFRYEGFEELLMVIGYSVYLQIGLANELGDRIGGSPLDNADTWYSGTTNDEALNAGVARFSTVPRAENYLTHYYLPTGQIQTPILTLYNTRDPIVPFGHAEAYQRAVAAAGHADLLRTNTIERFDHVLLPEETLAAFQELVIWVDSLE